VVMLTVRSVLVLGQGSQGRVRQRRVKGTHHGRLHREPPAGAARWSGG
jgi:hypothetical protein